MVDSVMQQNPADCWDFFDRVYCISLDCRPDRCEHAQREFERVGLGDRVEFFIVSPHPDNSEQGIFESHCRCIKQGLAAGAEHILLFEDDVFFDRFDPAGLQEACRALADRPHWQALFLGCLSRGSRPTDCPSLVSIRYQCLTQGYALNRSFAEDLLRQPWQDVPWDGLLQCMQKEYYALAPMCAFQDGLASDNRKVLLGWIRRLFGGLASIQKANEWYQRHKIMVILTHAAVLAAVAALLYQVWQ
jgi:GR25 family glycosyltransferase involved in LPS biosynthesis